MPIAPAELLASVSTPNRKELRSQFNGLVSLLQRLRTDDPVRLPGRKNYYHHLQTEYKLDHHVFQATLNHQTGEAPSSIQETLLVHWRPEARQVLAVEWHRSNKFQPPTDMMSVIGIDYRNYDRQTGLPIFLLQTNIGLPDGAVLEMGFDGNSIESMTDPSTDEVRDLHLKIGYGQVNQQVDYSVDALVRPISNVLTVAGKPYFISTMKDRESGTVSVRVRDEAVKTVFKQQLGLHFDYSKLRNFVQVQLAAHILRMHGVHG